MPNPRVASRRLKFSMVFLICALFLTMALQVGWVITVQRLTQNASASALGELATLDRRLDNVAVALDQAWLVGDPRMAQLPASTLLGDLSALKGAVPAGIITTRFNEVHRGIVELTSLLAVEGPDAAIYGSARGLVRDLRTPVGRLAAWARAATAGDIARVQTGVLTVAATTFMLAAAVLIAVVWRVRLYTRTLIRNERRLRLTLSAHRRVKYEAEHDPLTGLANRRLLLRDLARRIEEAERGGPAFALHLFDLDGLKAINDSHGHQAGDEVLAAIARELVDGVRASDLVGRLAGDEFIVMQARADTDTAEAMARRLQTRLRAPVRVSDDAVVMPSASVGTAVFGPDGRTAEALLRIADAALYRAKSTTPKPQAWPKLSAVVGSR